MRGALGALTGRALGTRERFSFSTRERCNLTALPLAGCDLGQAPPLEKHGFGLGIIAGVPAALAHYPVCAGRCVLFIPRHRPAGLTVPEFHHHPHSPEANGGLLPGWESGPRALSGSVKETAWELGRLTSKPITAPGGPRFPQLDGMHTPCRRWHFLGSHDSVSSLMENICWKDQLNSTNLRAQL